MPHHQVPKHGISRSFQNLRLFRGLTAFENVLVAALAVGQDRRTGASVATRELEAFGLSDVAAFRADELPYGARKRLETARALA